MSRWRSGFAAHRRAYQNCFTPPIVDPPPSDPDPPPLDPDPPSGPQLTTADLFIHYEAGDPASYPGSGTTWTNIGTGGSAYNATMFEYTDEELSTTFPLFDSTDGISSFLFSKQYLYDGTVYLSFNYMRFLRPDAISDNFTYCAWIKTTEVGHGTNHFQLMYIVSTETGELNNDFGFGIDVNGNLAYGDGDFANADMTICTTQPVNTGQWTFVAVTREKSTGEVVLYVNGIENTRGTCNMGNTLSTAEYVLIGSETDFPGYTFGGYIGAILGNMSVLTAQQILDNYDAQKALYGIA
jgi:hypothetical protein